MARHAPDPLQPVAVWSERDLMDGRTADALVVILRTGGCSWSRESGCLMCGYNSASLDSVSAGQLESQFAAAMEKHSGQQYIKIYTSGSFLDPMEVPPAARDAILRAAGEKAGRILVESRPEYMTAEALAAAALLVGKLEVAVGLETASDEIRDRCVNKGFSWADFEGACERTRDAGADVRTYLLLKPPYLTEGQAIADALASIERAGRLSATVSVNPVNVQRDTHVEALWKKSLYRPPWLWSLVDVLQRGSALTSARLVSAPSGGGSRRGVHNCGKCDDAVLKAVEAFSLTGDATALAKPKCACRERWLDYIDAERFAGTSGDLERLMPPQ